jgi:hypothetical protein
MTMRAASWCNMVKMSATIQALQGVALVWSWRTTARIHVFYW